jgi:hypothetical protein
MPVEVRGFVVIGKVRIFPTGPTFSKEDLTNSSRVGAP